MARAADRPEGAVGLRGIESPTDLCLPIRPGSPCIPGSFYGAIGIAQFMPSQVLRHGVDGNGDGVVDLFVLEDALFSMGNYLMANGWRGSMRSQRKRRRAIYNYNHSRIYVNTVLAVADHLEEGRTVLRWDESKR
jgi:membrane-bound lytic murein transglycosylase B